MSVVVRDPQSSEIFCLTKGADTTVMEVLQGTNENLMKKTISALDDFASDGLRKAKNVFYSKWEKIIKAIVIHHYTICTCIASQNSYVGI